MLQHQTDGKSWMGFGFIGLSSAGVGFTVTAFGLQIYFGVVAACPTAEEEELNLDTNGFNPKLNPVSEDSGKLVSRIQYDSETRPV